MQLLRVASNGDKSTTNYTLTLRGSVRVMCAPKTGPG